MNFFFKIFDFISNVEQKIEFSINSFSVNMTKSAGICGFNHIYWRKPEWKTSFFVQYVWKSPTRKIILSHRPLLIRINPYWSLYLLNKLLIHYVKIILLNLCGKLGELICRDEILLHLADNLALLIDNLASCNGLLLPAWVIYSKVKGSTQ